MLYLDFFFNASTGPLVVLFALSIASEHVFPQYATPFYSTYTLLFLANVSLGLSTYLQAMEALVNSCYMFRVFSVSNSITKVPAYILVLCSLLISAAFQVNDDLFRYKVTEQNGFYSLRSSDFAFSATYASISAL